MENNKHWRSRSGRGGLQVEKVSFEQPEGSEPHVCGRRAGHGMGGEVQESGTRRADLLGHCRDWGFYSVKWGIFGGF